MRRWLPMLLLMVVAACRGSAPAATGAAMTGAVAPRKAVEDFLSAVRAQDLQAMSVVWGTAKGPARDQLERSELEKREIIMQNCFTHDSYRILDEAPGEGGQRVLRVELKKGPLTKTPRFYTVKGPSERWYVQDAEITAVREICAQRQ